MCYVKENIFHHRESVRNQSYYFYGDLFVILVSEITERMC